MDAAAVMGLRQCVPQESPRNAQQSMGSQQAVRFLLMLKGCLHKQLGQHNGRGLNDACLEEESNLHVSKDVTQPVSCSALPCPSLILVHPAADSHTSVHLAQGNVLYQPVGDMVRNIR